ncbi:MAG: phosphoribosyltransferase [Nitrospirae bacterium]|nr:phosphoribosyltransferase [Nitrospirota bacterium]
MGLESIIKNVVHKKSDKFIWDEWFFYEDVASFLDVYNQFCEEFSQRAIEYDYICSLSKPGYPLSSILAYDLDIPLIINSFSELVYKESSYIFGIPPEIEIPIKDKSIFCVDLHTRTGGTIVLAKNIIDLRHAKKIDFAVIFNCYNGKSKDINNIKCLFEWKVIEKELNAIVKDAQRINETEFWMIHDEYWLTSDRFNELNIDKYPNEAIRPEILLPANTVEQLIKNELIRPTESYLKTNIFKALVEETIKNLQKRGVDKEIDTVVALSTAAIPLAFNIATEISKSLPGNNVKFIFLMNESLEDYKAKFEASQGILLCEDTVLSGGLMYSFFKLLIGTNTKDKIKAIVTIFDCKQFPKKGRKYLRAILSETGAAYLAGLSQ